MADLLSEEKRRACINQIIDYFQTERDEQIGVIAAESVLEFFLESVGKQLYNQGVENSTAFLREKFESLELDMESIKK